MASKYAVLDEQLGIAFGKSGALMLATSGGRFHYASNHVSSTRHLSDKQVERLEEFLSRHGEQLGSETVASIRERYLAPRPAEPRRKLDSPPPAPAEPRVEIIQGPELFLQQSLPPKETRPFQRPDTLVGLPSPSAMRPMQSTSSAPVTATATEPTRAFPYAVD
jgi:hypothetical protein